MRFHILDTETVGLKPFDHGGGICEISVRVLDSDFNEKDHFYSLINPEGPIGAGASGVHGILDEHVANSPTMIEWLEQVLPYDLWNEPEEPAYLIAHNAPFDMRFLSPYADTPPHIPVDTLRLARRYYPEAENHKLTTLAVIHNLKGFSAKDAHGAGQDTLVLMEFVEQLMKDTGMSLEELCLDAQKADPITKMPFGKYRGKLIAEVKSTDPSYIRWCLNKMENLQDDLREALESA